MFLIRNSRADVFCEKAFLKISQRPATLLSVDLQFYQKGDSGTGVFL